MVDGTGNVRWLPRQLGEVVKFALRGRPGLDGHLVDFDDLMFRLQRYRRRARSQREVQRELPMRITIPDTAEALV